MGHYLQHCTEVCIIATKNKKFKMKKGKNDHVLFCPRQIQSQKPKFVHEVFAMNEIDNCGELFGRAINLRNRWTTIGMEVIPNDSECWIFLKNQKGGSIAV